MKSAERRREIVRLLCNTETPVPANVLKEKFGISRQVIVQDIAILRANGYEVISTNRGYVLNLKARSSRVFKCRHSLEELIEEGEIIISAGGRIEDISVSHRLYGKISANIALGNRLQVEELYRSLVSGASKPLMSVTDGYHYHAVTADSEITLDEIENKLRERGFLIEN